MPAVKENIGAVADARIEKEVEEVWPELLACLEGEGEEDRNEVQCDTRSAASITTRCRGTDAFNPQEVEKIAADPLDEVVEDIDKLERADQDHGDA